MAAPSSWWWFHEILVTATDTMVRVYVYIRVSTYLEHTTRHERPFVRRFHLLQILLRLELAHLDIQSLSQPSFPLIAALAAPTIMLRTFISNLRR